MQCFSIDFVVCVWALGRCFCFGVCVFFVFCWWSFYCFCFCTCCFVLQHCLVDFFTWCLFYMEVDVAYFVLISTVFVFSSPTMKMLLVAMVGQDCAWIAPTKTQWRRWSRKLLRSTGKGTVCLSMSSLARLISERVVFLFEEEKNPGKICLHGTKYHKDLCTLFWCNVCFIYT